MVAAIRVTQRFSTAGQQRVLLGLGEAVDLVDEQHGLAPVHAERRAGVVDDGAHVLDAGRDRGELDEHPAGRLRYEVRERRLAGARAGPRAGSTGDVRPPAAAPSTSRRSGAPGASRCCWPTTSSSVRGRIRTASGASAAARSSPADGEQVAVTESPYHPRFTSGVAVPRHASACTGISSGSTTPPLVTLGGGGASTPAPCAARA